MRPVQYVSKLSSQVREDNVGLMIHNRIPGMLLGSSLLDRGSVTFIQNTQYGCFNADYPTLVPEFKDGTANLDPIDSRVQVDNLFNLHYYTPAQLANTGVIARGTRIARPSPAYTTGPDACIYPLQSVTFFSPGVPRRA
jgi:hypothetical protein